jgi:DNA uptake protein ComE-like DNA-binding protein
MSQWSGVASAFLATVFFATAASAQVGRLAGIVDPNIATAAQLEKLPHMTPALAKAIRDGRPFLSMTALNDLLSKSLSADQRKALYGTMFIHVNLNTAPKAEILLIPGVGEKMLHEFEEYRPYKALAQFRREIGKYVDAKELARLEGYVFVPIDLNTATDEALLSIPGVGSKMLHEFKEYRPYKSMEQFRREIGKYVSEGEVRRFERYVTIN